MPTFSNLLSDDAVHCGDGAYGSLFQSRGLPPGASPEMWGMENPDVVARAHAEFLEAGAEILTTNTFGGSGPKLGLGGDPLALNRKLTEVARRVADGRALVAGSVGPTGLFVEPLGPVSFKELVEIFKVQIRGLVEGGADIIKAETQFDLAEIRAVVIAAREVCDLPVMALMTFEGDKSLTGTPPATFVDAMQNLGVECLGINCSAGPDEMHAILKGMGERLTTPLHVQPNAGLPRLENGQTVFPLGPEEFAEKCLSLAGYGAKTLAGCCGATPDHIRALSGAMAGLKHVRPEPSAPAELVLVSRSGSVPFGGDHPSVLIGERVNPTGKETLTAELQKGVLDEALRLATEQIGSGAAVLDLNVGAPMVDEADILPRLVKLVTERLAAPLSLDSSLPEAVGRALWHCPGGALVNSISGEAGKLEELGPICKKFGAPFILLPLAGKKLPVTFAERLEVIERMLQTAEELGIPKRLILVDALVLTVSSKPGAALACLELIRHCRQELGLATTMGLSNVSFGLPARELVNATFLSMALGAGLSSYIANPSSATFMQARAASELLLARDPGAERFIAGYADWKPGQGGGGSGGATARRAEDPKQAVVLGDKDRVVGLIEAELDKGVAPLEIVNGMLIPGILEVGEKYEAREYFLPQLMLSAEAMQTGFARVKPLLAQDADQELPRVVMATVEGDIHDIGKSIVCLMLKNHGFEVIDLGKDVPAEKIIDAADEHKASLIGLSALMTTTMVRMEEVVELARKRSLGARIMVGGAVLSQAYADAIGADGYAPDAVAAVKLAQRLTGATVS